jgi:hypothetical protein
MGSALRTLPSCLLGEVLGPLVRVDAFPSLSPIVSLCRYHAPLVSGMTTRSADCKAQPHVRQVRVPGAAITIRWGQGICRLCVWYKLWDSLENIQDRGVCAPCAYHIVVPYTWALVAPRPQFGNDMVAGFGLVPKAASACLDKVNSVAQGMFGAAYCIPLPISRPLPAAPDSGALCTTHPLPCASSPQWQGRAALGQRRQDC